MLPVRRALTVVLLAGCLAAPAPGAAAAPPADRPAKLPALTPATHDGLTVALETGRISEARYAYERFLAAVAPDAASTAFGVLAPPDPRGGTLLARDLMLRLPALPPALRARAEALLARPTDGPDDPDLPFGVDGGYGVPEAPPLCDADMCVHYITDTGNKVPLLDAGGLAGVPDYVETVAGVMSDVWDFEVNDLGYRAPLDDSTSTNDGGGPQFDVYLTNLGDDGLYGYCTSDDPHISNAYRWFDLSAYCVLDNDYRATEYGYADVTLPLRVTAAHEFFHAVQFAYDAYEDAWLMEATATWVEDEVYDAIDDNRQYLPDGPLGDPTTPLDRSSGFRVYGDWIFFRFLSEYLGSGGVDDREVVRKIWQRADGSPDGPDQFSSQAVRHVLDREVLDGADLTFGAVFRDFGVWNTSPGAFYGEGAAYTPAPAQDSATITRGSPRARRVSSVDHLSHRMIRFIPGKVGPEADLRVSVDGPALTASPVAAVVVVKTGGVVSARTIRLSGGGRGAVRVDFGMGVRRVVVVIGSASVRYVNCYDGLGPFACFGGDPLDDDLPFEVVATLA